MICKSKTLEEHRKDKAEEHRIKEETQKSRSHTGLTNTKFGKTSLCSSLVLTLFVV